jgi:hypothetical protein
MLLHHIIPIHIFFPSSYLPSFPSSLFTHLPSFFYLPSFPASLFFPSSLFPLWPPEARRQMTKKWSFDLILQKMYN